MPHAATLLAGLTGLCATAIACGQRDATREQNPAALRPALRPLAFHAVDRPPRFEARVGTATVVLANPDNAAKPTTWEGPLEVQDSHSGTTCKADVSLISNVYASPGIDFLIVLSYSGSVRYVRYLDLRSCADRWAPLKVFSEGIEVSDDLITIQPACECPGGAEPCECSAASVLRVAANAEPAVLHEASRALTKQVLGVDFEGQRKVRKPKSPSAELVRD